MAPPRQRAVLVPALALLVSGIGFWLGEAGGRPLVELAIVVGIVGSVAVALAVTGRLVAEAAGGGGGVASFPVAFFAGLDSFRRGVDEMVVPGGEGKVTV